ncbi:hypothetical protein [Lacrimispora sp.]|nr:hypothetical protein [Lacrimispora sp.]
MEIHGLMSQSGIKQLKLINLEQLQKHKSKYYKMVIIRQNKEKLWNI